MLSGFAVEWQIWKIGIEKPVHITRKPPTSYGRLGQLQERQFKPKSTLVLDQDFGKTSGSFFLIHVVVLSTYKQKWTFHWLEIKSTANSMQRAHSYCHQNFQVHSEPPCNFTPTGSLFMRWGKLAPIDTRLPADI